MAEECQRAYARTRQRDCRLRRQLLLRKALRLRRSRVEVQEGLSREDFLVQHDEEGPRDDGR
jgi:hypothetical protein